MPAYRFLICSDSLPRYRLWLVWVLCLCAWRGPLPIVHRHSLQSQVLAGDLHLAAHAVHHHSRDIGAGESGWHMHLVWPRSGGDDLPADDDDQAAPGLAWPCVLESSAWVANANDFAPVHWALSDAILAAPLSLAQLSLPAKPLPLPERNSKRISPHAALCVARC